jgi:hypothetical protein
MAEGSRVPAGKKYVNGGGNQSQQSHIAVFEGQDTA